MLDFDSYRGRNVLITGGLGFIGSNIAQRLAPTGAKITIVDSLSPLYGGNLANIEEIRNQVELHVADFRDPILMKPLIQKADVIFHLAAQVSYIDSSRIPFEDLDLNCRGTLQLLELCRNANLIGRVVFASSRLVLGRIVSSPVQEDHPTAPLSLYGIHKLTAEKYFQMYASIHGLRTIVLRVTNPYGERQQLKHSKYSLPGWFMRQVLEGKPITVFGDGSQLRDYVYATDLVDAFLSVGLSDVPAGELFNCGFGRAVPFREMAETVAHVLKKGTVEYVPWPPDYEKVETGDVRIDTSKLGKAIGWEPRISLEEGIERMWHYYESRWPLYV